MALTIRDMMAGPSFGCGTTPYRKNVSEMDAGGPGSGRHPEEGSKKESPSCWGCGHDYKSRWSAKDLVPHPTEKGFKVCPGCYEEITQGDEDSMVKAAGTSEGATKGWDTRGRGKAMHDVLLNRGFKLRNRGKQENSYRRSSGSSLHVITTTPSGWQHDYGSLRTGNVVTNAEGTDEKDLDAYLGKRGFGK